MDICGIVAEYDPFHLGHLYQIEAARAMGAGAVVAVMSGSFTQRGEAACFGKYLRAEMAASCGADLVLELPVPFAVASAGWFARGAVAILAAAGCDSLCFGSESGDISALRRAAELAGDRELLLEARDAGNREGLSFPAARQLALERRDPAAAELLRQPNNLLGVEYISAIHSLGCGMRPVTVKRLGAGHREGPRGSTASAGHIRGMLRRGEDPGEYMPPAAAGLAREATGRGELSLGLGRAGSALLYRLRLMEREQFSLLPDCAGGLGDRIYSAAGRAGSLEELYSLAKTRRYTMSRVKRGVLSAALGITAALQQGPPPYLRVLAAGGRGRELMGRMAKSGALPVGIGLAGLSGSGGAAAEFAAAERRAYELHCLTMARPPKRGEELGRIYFGEDRK